MRIRMWLGIITLLAVRTVSAADVPITSNPIPEPIVKRGIAVEVKDLARLPDTRGLRPADQDVAPAAWARVSYVRDLPDGRRFANESRGFLYLIDKTMGKPAPRADLHISRSHDGELFLTSRQDGMIRMLVPDSGTAGAASEKR